MNLSVPSAFTQEYEELELYNNYDEYGALADAAGGGGGGKGQPKLGFSAGSGLRSIAEGSFNSANDAVNNQDAAGHQAAFVAKNTLAQAAAGVSNAKYKLKCKSKFQMCVMSESKGPTKFQTISLYFLRRNFR
jgi:DnaJ-class molecular chaperone